MSFSLLRVFFFYILAANAVLVLGENEKSTRKTIDINLEEVLGQFDPVKWLPDIKMNFDKLKVPKIVRGNVDLDTLYVEGFSKGTASIKVTILGVEIKLNLQNVILQGNHFSDAVFMQMVKMDKSKGRFKLSMGDVKATIKLGYIITGTDKPLKIKFKDVKVDSATDIELTGIFNDDYKSEIIAKETAEVLDLFLNHEVFKNILNSVVTPIINALLFAFNITLKSIKP